MSPSDLSRLGSFIAQQRTKLDMSQNALAIEVGVTRSTILRMERGDFGRPDPEKLQRIARALDLDAEDFFELAGYAPDESLPALRPYLRRKLGLSDEDQEKVERYITRVRKQAAEESDGKRPR